MLNIPIQKNNRVEKQKTKDTRVDNNVKWQDQHFKSLKASYNCSPFFEFFEDDLHRIYNKKYRFLNDLNFDAFLFLTDALQLEIRTKKQIIRKISKYKKPENLKTKLKSIMTEEVKTKRKTVFLIKSNLSI